MFATRYSRIFTRVLGICTFGLWAILGGCSQTEEERSLTVAAVEVNKKWGWIDTEGNWVIEPQEHNPSQFNEGLAFVVRPADEQDSEDLAAPIANLYGFIDTQGKTAIRPQFQLAFPHSEGLALVRDGDKLMFIDKQGNPSVRMNYGFAMHFSEGLVVVADSMNSPRGYMDKSGKLIVQPKYDRAKPFHNGLGVVVRMEKDSLGKPKHLWGAVDATGKEVLPLTYRGLGPQFREGLNRFAEYNRFGFITNEGKVHLKPAYLFAHCFRKDVAPVMGYNVDREPKWGVINKEGRQLVDFVFDMIDTRGYGTHDRILVGRMVGEERLYGYLNGKGEVIVPLQYPLADVYSEGRAMVMDKESGKWGYIDTDGKWLIPPSFDRATHFVNTHKNYLTDPDYLRDE